MAYGQAAVRVGAGCCRNVVCSPNFRVLPLSWNEHFLLQG